MRKFVDMLKDTRALVAKSASEGKSPDQMKKEKVLAKYEDLGKGFIKTDAWIDLLYAELQHTPAAGSAYQDHGHADEKAGSK